MEEYLNAPSAENLLALGSNRAQIIADTLARNSPTDSQAEYDVSEPSSSSLFKVAALYTTVSACRVDGCGAQVESAVEETVGEFVM